MLSMLAYISMSAHHPPTQLIINLTHTMDQMQTHRTTLAKADSKFDGNKSFESEAIYRKNPNNGHWF